MRLVVLLLPLVLVAGCLGGEEVAPPPAGPREQVATDAASLRPIEETFTGEVSGTPVAPGVVEFEFSVPTGAVGVNGTLSWELPVAQLGLELVDPNGEVVDTGYQEAEGRLVVATVDLPPSGTWTFRVLGETPVPTTFTLDAVAELLVPENNVVAKTVTVGAFYEVNLIMEANATFRFAFNATQPVKWDVHSHPPEGLKYWDQGEGTTADGSFTAPDRGIYSILWENAGPVPAELSFELTGRFRLHSHAQ